MGLKQTVSAPGPSTTLLVGAAFGWASFFCAQYCYRWLRTNRPQYLFLVKHRQTIPSRHPHEAKIQQLRARFDVEALRHTLRCQKPDAHSSLHDLPCTWISTRKGVAGVAQKLRAAKVFSVDIECHQVFSYATLPCLLQLAVGNECYVVDLLAVHDHMAMLKPPFEDAAILKLFHGCLGDLEWLQRFNIYTVNVLDTCELAKEAVKVQFVQKPGLGSLLPELCGVDANKSIAASDWRQRPLTDEMISYCVADVRYLQYIAMTLVDLAVEQSQASVSIGSALRDVGAPGGGGGGAAEGGMQGTLTPHTQQLRPVGSDCRQPGVPEADGGSASDGCKGCFGGVAEAATAQSAQGGAGSAAEATEGLQEAEGPHEVVPETAKSPVSRAASLELKTAPLDEHALHGDAAVHAGSHHDHESPTRALNGVRTSENGSSGVAVGVSQTRMLPWVNTRGRYGDAGDLQSDSSPVEPVGLATCFRLDPSVQLHPIQAACDAPQVSRPECSTAPPPELPCRGPGDADHASALADANSSRTCTRAVGDGAVVSADDSTPGHGGKGGREEGDVPTCMAEGRGEEDLHAVGVSAGCSRHASPSTEPQHELLSVAGTRLPVQRGHGGAEAGAERANGAGMLLHHADQGEEAAAEARSKRGHRGGKKGRRQRENRRVRATVADAASEAAGEPPVPTVQADAAAESTAMDLFDVWKRCVALCLTVHREAPVEEAARSAMSKMLNKEVDWRRKMSRANKDGGKPLPLEPCLPRIFAVLCYWRTAVAKRADISPAMVMPDTVVTYFLKHRPRGTLAVLRCMLRWVTSHRRKHAERMERGKAAPAEQKEACSRRGRDADRNPFSWYLDNWEPGLDSIVTAPWLASLLLRAYAGSSQLPVQVDRMIAYYESQQQHRVASGNPGKKKATSIQQPTAVASPFARSTPSQAVAKSKEQAEQKAGAGGRQRIIEKFSKKAPAYDNCRMLSQDGTMLAACDLKKLAWYVAKGLADWQPDQGPDSTQPTIRLNFQHKVADQQNGTDAFYFEVKVNQCVGCGETGHYLKYKIVPDCYRKNFPVHMKSHRSHDVVLLCIDCHERAHTSAEALKRQLAHLHSIPLQPGCMAIRSDPFLPTPPAEELVSSREEDLEAASCADAESDVGADVDPGALASAREESAGGGSSSGEASLSAPARPSEVHASAGESTGAHGGGAVRQQPETSEAAVGGGAVSDGDAAVQERTPSPAHVRRVALTLDRQTSLPEERRQELVAVVLRYVHGPSAPVAQGLGQGDLEAALLAGLGKTKRNQTVTRLAQAGRPTPTGYALSHQDGHVRVVSAPHDQGGHLWHGRKVVEQLLSTHGQTGLQELVVAFRKEFIAAVQPKHLPGAWSLYHDAPREFGSHSIFSEVTPSGRQEMSHRPGPDRICDGRQQHSGLPLDEGT